LIEFFVNSDVLPNDHLRDRRCWLQGGWWGGLQLRHRLGLLFLLDYRCDLHWRTEFPRIFLFQVNQIQIRLMSGQQLHYPTRRVQLRAFRLLLYRELQCRLSLGIRDGRIRTCRQKHFNDFRVPSEHRQVQRWRPETERWSTFALW
jgi:hypothetical protein